MPATMPLAIRRGRLPLWAPFLVGSAGTALGLGYVVFLAPMRDGFRSRSVKRCSRLSQGERSPRRSATRTRSPRRTSFLMENSFVTGTVLTVDGGFVLTGN